MRHLISVLAIILTSCQLGHKEVKLAEMAAPPRLIVQGNQILIKTETSKENPSFTLYEILPTIDEGERSILLKGHEGMYRDPMSEFIVKVTRIKPDSLALYKIFWVDPDNSKTQLKFEVDSTYRSKE